MTLDMLNNQSFYDVEDVMGKVYIARGGELYKFGVAEIPEDRLKVLQTGSPVKLELVHTFDARTPRKMEAALKREFASKHVHGEWYRLTEADVLTVKQATTTVDTPPATVNTHPRTVASNPKNTLLILLIGIPLIFALEYYRHDQSQIPMQPMPTGVPTVLVVRPTIPVVTAPTVVPLAGVTVPVPPPVQSEASELIPIPTEQWEVIAPVETPIVIQAYFPPPTPNPLIEMAVEAATALTEAGYEFSDKPFEISTNYVGK